MGGLESRIRANSFTLNADEDITLTSSGSILDISAPVSIFSSTTSTTEFNAHNNVEILSHSGTNSFTALSDVTLNANYIDMDGQLSFTASVDDDLSLSAAAIVEFASVNTAKNIFDDMSIVVSSGDVELNAAGILSITTQNDPSTITWSAFRNNFVVSRSAAESIIQFQTNSDLSISATEQVTFANFDEASDITFAGQNDITMAAPSVGVTTSYGSITARNDLNMFASEDMNIEVTMQDIKATAITGNIEVSSVQGAFSLTTFDSLNTHSREVYIDTQTTMTIDSDNEVSFRQNDINSEGGALRLNIGSDFDIFSTDSVEFDTAGTHDFTVGGDSTVSADSITIAAVKAVDNIQFQTGDTVTISSPNIISYRSDIYSLSTNTYDVTSNTYSVNARNNINILTGDTTTVTATDVDISSQFEDVILTSGTTLNFDTNDDITFAAFQTGFNSKGNTFVTSDDDVTFSAGDAISAEIEREFDITVTDTANFNADNTQQFLANTLTVFAENANLFAGEAIYISQNLPDDSVRFLNLDDFDAEGDYITVKAGGNVNINAPDFTSTGDGTFKVEGFNAINANFGYLLVDAAGLISVKSNGALDIEAGDVVINASSNFQVIGPQGENGLFKFATTNDLTKSTNDYAATATDISITSGDDASYTATQDFSITGNGNGMGDFFVFSENDILLSSDDFTSISELGTFFFAGENFNLNTFAAINFIGQTATEFQSTNLIFNAQSNFDVDVDFDDGLLVMEGDDFKITVGDELIFDAADDFSLYSGGYIRYSVASTVTLTSQTLVIDGRNSVNGGANTVTVSSADDVFLLSQGATDYNFAGTTTTTSTDMTQYEAATFVIKSGPADWNVENGDFNSYNYDGVTTFWASNFGTFDAVTAISYDTEGNTFVNGGVITFNANTNDFTTTTSLPEADIIFDSIYDDVTFTTTNVFEYKTDNYGDFYGAGGIEFDSETSLSVTVAQDFDFFSQSNTEGIIGGNMIYTSGDFGNFHSENRIEFNAFGAFTFEADENFLVSTGEQGTLTMDSDANYHAHTTESQSWRSSGDFNIISQTGTEYHSSKDTSVFSTGGPIVFDVNNNGPMTAIIGEDFTLTSGDMIAFTSNGKETWSAGTTFTTTAQQGNIVFTSPADITYTAVGSMILQANGERNPTDGFEIESAAILTFETDVANPTKLSVLPSNNLIFGGLTHPQVTVNAGGSPTQDGFTLTSDGDVVTLSGTDKTSYTNPTGQFEADIGGGSEMYSETTFTITTTGPLDITSDAGIVHFHGEAVEMTSQGSFTTTASTGIFEIVSDAESPAALGLQANADVLFTANLFRADVGPFEATIAQAITNTITKSATYKTTVGDNGSFLFNSNNIVFDSVGAITGQVLGHDGSALVQGGDVTLTTLTSGDISLVAKSSMDMDYAGALSFTSNNGFVIEALSNIGEDLTRGDIGFFGATTFSSTIGDSLDFTADRDVSLSADDKFTVQTTGDVTFDSTDDTIVRYGTTFTGTATKELIWENSKGNSGDVTVYSGSLTDTVTFSANDDTNWNAGGNVNGYSLGAISFTTNKENAQDEAIYFSTTTSDFDIFGKTSATLQSRDVFNINSNTGATGKLSFLVQDSFTNTAGNKNTFTSQSGSVDIVSGKGDVFISGLNNQFIGSGTNGRISMVANGISENSNSAVSNDATTVTFTAGNTLTVNAYESIEMQTSLDILSLGTTLPATARFLASGLGQDIHVNTAAPQDRVAILDFQADQIDIASVETTRFISESGFVFSGVVPKPVTDRPSDIFFVSEGSLAGVALATSDNAALADIDISVSAAVFDSDLRLTIRSDSELGGATRIYSEEYQVDLDVDSTDATDNLVISGYRGSVALQTEGNDMVFVPAGEDLQFIGRQGMQISGQDFVVNNPVSGLFQISATEEDVSISVNSLTWFAANSFSASSQKDFVIDIFGDSFIGFNNMAISAPRGNIYVNFADFLTMVEVTTSITFNQNGLAIPMRENTVFSGRTCIYEGEFVIAHNTQDYVIVGTSPFATPVTPNRISDIKDTGILICYCESAAWACRPLSQAFRGP